MSRGAEAACGKRGFLRRLTLATAWGEGLDGYDLGVLSVVLPLIATSMHISPVWAGLIGAGAEYTIGAAMLAEFAPSQGRGRRPWPCSWSVCGPTRLRW